MIQENIDITLNYNGHVVEVHNREIFELNDIKVIAFNVFKLNTAYSKLFMLIGQLDPTYGGNSNNIS